MTSTASTDGVVLTAPLWRERQAVHERAVDALTAGHLDRREKHLHHPVHDFLFTYYQLSPAQLRRWHPGVRVVLAGAGERAGWRFYRVVNECDAVVDEPAVAAARGPTIAFVRELLRRTAEAASQFGCFGLHEWAMVFEDGGDRRHIGRPLRLGRAGTDEVVRSHQIRCSHFDAYRFFTPGARPLNQLTPTLEGRATGEQSGCLHATMDLYKWAYKLGPVVPGELLLDCFRLAQALRELDMRASPYDLADLGYPPVPIETPAGKATYVAAQRELTARGQTLRARLLDVTLSIAGEAVTATR